MLYRSELDSLLAWLDAHSDVERWQIEAIADLLEEAGWYYEACVLREQQMFAIRLLRCGHYHVRCIGCGYDLSQLGPCAWTGGQEA